MLNIDELIKQAMKAKSTAELTVYKALKAKIQEFKTAKNAKPYDESAELGIIKKLVAQHKDSITCYTTAGRTDLVGSEQAELEVLQKMLPPEVTKDTIETAFKEWVAVTIDGGLNKKHMGLAIKALKDKFPSADGKIIADVVKSFIP